MEDVEVNTGQVATVLPGCADTTLKVREGILVRPNGREGLDLQRRN